MATYGRKTKINVYLTPEEKSKLDEFCETFGESASAVGSKAINMFIRIMMRRKLDEEIEKMEIEDKKARLRFAKERREKAKEIWEEG